MVKFWKKNEKAAAFLKSLLVMYVLTGVMLLLLAFLLYKFRIPNQVVGIGILVIYISAVFLGGRILGKSMKVKKYLWGLLGGKVYFLILLLISILVKGGIEGNVFPTWMMCCLGGMLGGMLG